MTSLHAPRRDRAPSPWVTRWARLFAPGAAVLDVACGAGHHVRWLAARGYRVTGIDRDGAALAALASLGSVHTIRAISIYMLTYPEDMK